jgi:ABC-2 type transport system permease protein
MVEMGGRLAWYHFVVSLTAHPVLHNSADTAFSSRREIRELIDSSNLLWNLVRRDLTVRYKRSVIGFFWTMLHPLILMVILTIVFSKIFRFEGIAHYEVYFLSEYLVFAFFAQTTVQSMTSLSWNGMLLKRVRVPKSIFAISNTLSGLVNLCLAYIPLFAIMIVRGAPIRPAVLFLPVAFVVIAIFTLGVSLLLSALAVYFEDVSQMYQAATMALMYLTPIIYPIEIIPYKFLWLIRINPLTQLFKLARDPVYNGVLPDFHIFGASVVVAGVALMIGWFIFHRLSRGFYEHL